MIMNLYDSKGNMVEDLALASIIETDNLAECAETLEELLIDEFIFEQPAEPGILVLTFDYDGGKWVRYNDIMRSAQIIADSSPFYEASKF